MVTPGCALPTGAGLSITVTVGAGMTGAGPSLQASVANAKIPHATAARAVIVYADAKNTRELADVVIFL
ncbi:MAG: hypothetical protein ABJB66_21155 [Gemmatimonadaceae bacterium]